MAEAWAQVGAVTARRHRGLVISERKLMLAGLDILAVAGAFVLAFNLRTAPEREAGFYVPRLGTAVAVVSWLVCAQVLGAYDLRNTRRLTDILRTVGTTTAATSVVLLGFFFVVPYRITRPTLLGAIPLIAVCVLLERLLYRRAFAGSHFATRIALVAREDVMAAVWPTVAPYANGLYRVAAVVNPDRQDVRDRLHEAMAHRDVAQVVLGVRDDVSRDLFRGVLDCHEAGARVRSLADLYEELTGRMLLDQLGHSWLLALPLRAETSHVYATFKRAVDIGVALVAMIAVGILLPPLAVLIRADGGPIFHRQTRVGKFGRPFTLLKFRTMRHQPAAASEWTRSNDARITRVGRVLRRLHLDELPQAWSILRGDMSLIGPRPEQPHYVEELGRVIDFYNSRLTLRPGLTGWAQVQEGYCDGVEGARVKLSYDLYYVKRQSVSLDILIMARTLRAVLALGGR